jgi:hypothetical protein
VAVTRPFSSKPKAVDHLSLVWRSVSSAIWTPGLALDTCRDKSSLLTCTYECFISYRDFASDVLKDPSNIVSKCEVRLSQSPSPLRLHSGDRIQRELFLYKLLQSSSCLPRSPSEPQNQSHRTSSAQRQANAYPLAINMSHQKLLLLRKP